MDAGQPPSTAPALDARMADADRQQLRASDVPMLSGGDDRDLYRGVISI